MKVIILAVAVLGQQIAKILGPTPTSSHQCFTSWKACHALRILEPPSASPHLGAKILVQRQHQVISVSRHGKPATLSASWSHQVQWVCSDVTRDTNWQEQVQRADWVIDTVGILFENPRKKNLSTANSDASEKISSF